MMNVNDAINKRRTTKILGTEPWPLPDESVNDQINQIVKSAEMAPFHYQSHKSFQERSILDSPVPWRVYVLQADNCRKLAAFLVEEEIKAGKILQMLNSANAMLQVTWLPDPQEEEGNDLFEGNLRNMEHIAAASAAIQNMLLTATAINVPNYWSSGGVLRKNELFKKFDISTDEILVGSVFLFPEGSDIASDHQVALGGLRDKKGEINQWSKVIDL